MSWAGAKGDPGRLRGEVALLLLLSSVVVAALVVAIVDNGTVSLSGASRAMLLVSLADGRCRACRAHGLPRHATSPRARPRQRPGDGGAAQEPADRGSHHQGRAAGPGVLGAGPGRARDDAYADRHRGPAPAACRAAQVRPMARPCLRPGAQERARRSLRRRPAVQLAAQDDGRRPRGGRRPGGRRTGDPAAARRGRAQARPRPDPRSAPPARARYPGRPHAARRAAHAGLAARRRRAPAMGQRGVCEGRGGQQREGGARAPDRAAGDAPARGRRAWR